MRVRRDFVRFVDSYASLLVLLLANFFLLQLVADARWGAIGSTLLSALALVVAISDPDAGHRITRRHALQIAACVALAPLVLIVNSASVVGLIYLLPRCALGHRDTACDAESSPATPANHARDGAGRALQLMSSSASCSCSSIWPCLVALTTLGFGDLSPAVGMPQALTVLEALPGRVFLVTMVARLVTLWVRESPAADGD